VDVKAKGVTDGGYFADQMSAGKHMAVVDGFTPEGPLVVSWGQTLQMTWAQWNTEVVNIWGSGRADAPPRSSAGRGQ